MRAKREPISDVKEEPVPVESVVPDGPGGPEVPVEEAVPSAPVDSKPVEASGGPVVVFSGTLRDHSSFSASHAMGRLVVFDGSRRRVLAFDRNRPLTITVSQ